MTRISAGILSGLLLAAVVWSTIGRAQDQGARARDSTAAATSTPGSPVAELAERPQGAAPAPTAKPAASPIATDMPAAAQSALVKEYCATCHSERGKAGGLSLAGFDAAKAEADAAVSEKIIRKLRAGMMPPSSARRPEPARITALAEALENRLDRAAALRPTAGWRPFQRLNRAEYARAVKDLLAVDVDVTALLPADTLSDGFDNIADAQAFSATLLSSYLRAAGRVTTLALGDRDAPASEANYKVAKTASQLGRVDGAPLGTRGGLSVLHTFPADGEYVFRMDLHGNACGVLFGGTVNGEKLEISIDGAPVAVLAIDPRMTEATTGVTLKTPPVYITAGARRVTAAFVQQFEGPVIDLLAPIDHTLADTQIGVAFGITTMPHLKDLSIVGPYRSTGVSETASRRRVFTCRPTQAGEEMACASDIVGRLAAQAFRGTVTGEDRAALMAFYEDGRRQGDFETGIAAALEAILASPQFLFRVEPAPAPAAAGRNSRITNHAIASRLSFFLWGTAPDAELLRAAEDGRLSRPGEVERQVRRLIADRRSEALSTRFAAQWLRLNDVDEMLPDALMYPYYDYWLGQAFKRETELFFDSLVRDDRSILDLLTADYTFANERVARHYGIPNVAGQHFRRVPVPEYRRGILGHGSVLTLTSVADRTSPVMRGKWVMEVLLGSPPPAPPPNVPPFDDTKAAAGGKLLSVRERMEEHRRNPACTSCHRVIDPLGLALDNFDVTGRWRIKDNGVPIDASGQLYDGTEIDGPSGLRGALLAHKDAVLANFTERLLTYAIGRRLGPSDMPTVRAIMRQAARSDYRLSSFIVGVAMSNAFQSTSGAGAETTAAPVGEDRR
jgi:mono/diheme cytochrome c family protein